MLHKTFNSRDKLFKVDTPDYYRVKSVPVSSAVLISVIITCVTCSNPNTVYVALLVIFQFSMLLRVLITKPISLHDHTHSMIRISP